MYGQVAVVGSRGGIKIGGMYGVLPSDSDMQSDSFQVAIKGFIKDVITQLKRDLNCFWVAHPDFVRLGLALVEAWKRFQNADHAALDNLVKALLLPKYHVDMLAFIHGADVAGLDPRDALYPRALLVADEKQSNFIANNDPHKFFHIKSTVVQLVPDFPARTLGGCQIIHHAHGHAINRGRKRNATITAEPVGEILQRLKNVVANFARIIIGDEVGLLFVGHQQRART